MFLRRLLTGYIVGNVLFSGTVSANETTNGTTNIQTVTAVELGPVKVGEMFPTFGGHTLNNEYVSLQTLMEQDKTIVISYFATWCQPCRIGLPKIEKLVQENDNVVAVYIALGEKSSGPVVKMVADLQLETAVVLDKFEAIGMRHGVVIEGKETVLPITFVLGKNGVVQTIFTVEGEDFSTKLLESLQVDD